MKFSYLQMCLRDICSNIEKTVYSVDLMNQRDSYSGPVIEVKLVEAIRNFVRVSLDFSFWYGFHYSFGDDASSHLCEADMVKACEQAVDRINSNLPRWFEKFAIDDEFDYHQKVACVFHDDGSQCGVEGLGSIEGWLYLE